MQLFDYKNPIFLQMDTSFASLSAAETAINDVMTNNPGYCLLGLDYLGGGSPYYVFDEDWGVQNPIHSVVLVEVVGNPATQDIPTALSNNPGYHYVDARSITGPNVIAIVLGSS